MTGEGTHVEPPPIIQYWHEDEAPDYIASLLATFAEFNPERPQLVFSERSAAAFIAEHLGSRRVRAFQACAVPAMQADYFRYCATLVLGGIYCDADFRCIASIGPVIPLAGEGHLFKRDGEGGAVVNGFFAFGSPGHRFLELVLDVVTTNIERRSADSVYAVTGPLVFTNLYRLHRLGSFEALVEQMAKRPSAPYARSLCKAIGDYERVDRAFEGIKVSSAESNSWIRAPEGPLPYKETDSHWTNVKQSIFRE